MRYTLADLERVLAVCGHVGLGRTPDEVCDRVIRAHDRIVELRELEDRVRELEAIVKAMGEVTT